MRNSACVTPYSHDRSSGRTHVASRNPDNPGVNNAQGGAIHGGCRLASIAPVQLDIEVHIYSTTCLKEVWYIMRRKSEKVKKSERKKERKREREREK
ncbi:hypothetical protein PUN28_009238 [Cardiocondyla obscurior]|uniref:Uncharacterized protein n=1 Tax=Cardiocondyla obscurior TaxID=286306 RepID=A0AAW2FTF4_9HYME